MNSQDIAGGAFVRRDGRLFCERVPLDVIAERFGTPAYVYSRNAIETAFAAYTEALQGRSALVCYAMKANSNLAVLNVLARAGSGFDIVSGGELSRVLAAGGDPRKVVFSGVGKTQAEIDQALDAQILCFNAESAAELEMIETSAARRATHAPVSIRVNPDVDAGTHPYISTGLKSNKFGVAWDEARGVYRRAKGSRHLDVIGIDCHIGSQITEAAPFINAAERVLDLVQSLASDGIELQHIDFGGGLGIRYRDERPPPVRELISALLGCIDSRGLRDKTLLFEPGRSIVGAAGVLLSRVTLLKSGPVKNFAVIDAAMNDLARPAMYQAWVDVQSVVARSGATMVYDVVGPVCESGDWLARDRALALESGDLIALMDAGAYGMSMASNYNSRGRAVEVMVDGEQTWCVRQRETAAQLYAGESTLP